MKSKLSPQQDHILVELSLRDESEVAFELREMDDELRFMWREQPLAPGEHLLKLELPLHCQGKLILRLIAGTNTSIDHLIYLSD